MTASFIVSFALLVFIHDAPKQKERTSAFREHTHRLCIQSHWNLTTPGISAGCPHLLRRHTMLRIESARSIASTLDFMAGQKYHCCSRLSSPHSGCAAVTRDQCSIGSPAHHRQREECSVCAVLFSCQCAAPCRQRSGEERISPASSPLALQRKQGYS